MVRIAESCGDCRKPMEEYADNVVMRFCGMVARFVAVLS